MTTITNFFISLACITFLFENPQAIQTIAVGIANLF
jgi:hypothetical protein